MLLGAEEMAALEAAQRRTGASRGELIRRAVLSSYARPAPERSSLRGRFAHLDGGVWSEELDRGAAGGGRTAGVSRPWVLDASAVIALLRDEQGADRVEEAMSVGAVIGTPNLSEVCSALGDHGVSAEDVAQTIEALELVIEPFLRADAELAGSWRAATRHLGLGLGDRACLALAWRLGATALTADHVWAQVDLGVCVELLRPRPKS